METRADFLNTSLPLELHRLARVLGKERFPALKDVSLRINPGTIHALLGPNGAGKTTTIKVCAGLLFPSSGTALVGGVDVAQRPEEARRRSGLVFGGELGFYPRATARDNLLYFADIAGVPTRERDKRVNEALERVGLSNRANAKVEALSHGMVQRLHLARAICPKPPLLLLDEPTSGLDPEVSLRIRTLIRTLADEGTGILLTSHLMGEVEELADVISLIGDGRVTFTGSASDIARKAHISAVTIATFSAREWERLGDVEGALNGRASAVWKAHASSWILTLLWHTLERSYTQMQAYFASVCAERGVTPPDDTLTRAPSLEESYLSLADGLARQ